MPAMSTFASEIPANTEVVAMLAVQQGDVEPADRDSVKELGSIIDIVIDLLNADAANMPSDVADQCYEILDHAIDTYYNHDATQMQVQSEIINMYQAASVIMYTKDWGTAPIGSFSDEDIDTLNVICGNMYDGFNQPSDDENTDADTDTSEDEIVTMISEDTAAQDTTETVIGVTAAVTVTSETDEVTEEADEVTEVVFAEAPAAIVPMTGLQMAERTVDNIYMNTFNHWADAEGRTFWVNQVVNNSGKYDAVIEGILTSSEVDALELSDDEFVVTAYRVIFNRMPTDSEKADWTAALSNGASRSEVVEAFLNSTEFTSNCFGG